MLEAAADGAVANVISRCRPRGIRLPARRNRPGRTDRPNRVLVRVENESDRINLNTASIGLLRAFIIAVGGTPSQANQLSAAILDWRTSGTVARQGGAKAVGYRAAGRAYGPPEAPFQSVDELADVLGMTPDLFERLEPHLTVLTDGDPDMSTRDVIVARALTDAAGVAGDTGAAAQTADALLRISVTAIGPGLTRYSRIDVVSADFQNTPPRVKILWQQRVVLSANSALALH